MNLKKRFSPHPGQVKFLPAPSINSRELEQETILARQLLGITVRPGKSGEAIVKSLKGDSVWRSVAYHHSSSFVDGSPLELHRAFGYTSEFTLLVRAVRQSPSTFVRHLQNEEETSNEARTQFLEDVKEWALPRKTQQIFGHDLLIWGPTSVIVPEGREETAALYGKVINYFQLGSVARSVLYGLPMDVSEIRRDPITGSVDPVWYAAPRKVVWYSRFYVMPDINRAFAFWSGVVTPDNIGQLLELGDLLLRAENVERNLYFSALLRVSANISNGKPDFNGTASQLTKLGKWEQRSGNDIRAAFQAFIPGALPFPSWHRHSVAKPVAVFKNITQSLKTVGDRNGTNMIGTIDGQPLLLDPWMRPGRFYEGPSKSGKSTLAAAHAAQVTKNILWFPLTAGQFEAAPYWVQDFGGTVISLNLPDAYTIMQSEGAKLENRAIVQRQEELHANDRAEAESSVQQLIESWHKRGKIVGLPLTFRVESGDTIRLLNWYVHFLAAWREAWRHWFERTGEWALVVGDNFSALRLSGDDPILGEIPEATGRNLGLAFAWLVSNGRNIGNACWVLTHAIQDLDYISTGLYNQFGLHISLRHDDYTLATVIQPKEREVLAPQLYIRLPQPIKSEVERREPSSEGAIQWTPNNSLARS